MSMFGMSPDSLGGGIFGFIGQERTNASNAQQAARQIDFQREQSETVHQRAVKDLIAAGLNPILSATRGGNPAMQGAQATMQNSAQAALEGRRSNAELHNLEANRENIIADTAMKDSTKRLQNALAHTSAQDYKLRTQQYETEKHVTAEQFWSAQSAMQNYKGHKIEGDIDSGAGGEASRWIRRFIPFFNSAGQAARGGFRVR